MAYTFTRLSYRQRVSDKIMEKLSVCRICLASDLRMEILIDTNLQDIYEKLTLISLETKDVRPVQACYICCARLQNCYLLKMNCLQSEELFTQIINNNELLQPVYLQEVCTSRLGMTPVVVESFGSSVPDDFGSKMETPAPNSPVPVQMEMKLHNENGESRREQLVSHNEELASDHGESDSQDEIPIDIVKHEIGTINERELPSTLTTENQKTLQLKNTNQEGFVSLKRTYNSIQYKCDLCRRVYHTRGTLTKHLKTHNINEGYKEKKKKNQSHRTEYKSLNSLSGEKPYKCDTCKISFSRKRDLNNHKMKHNNKREFVCPICKITFNFKYILTNHIKETHFAEKLYECETCSKKFSNDISLNRHKLTHSDEKVYKCDTCSKLYLNKSDLEKHIKVHLKLKPYQCNVCDKRFTEQCYLIYHSRVHSAEKPYKCDVCKKGFAFENDRSKHMRVHK